MFKKILATTLIFAATLSTSYASSIYLGMGAVYEWIYHRDISYDGISPKLAVGYSEWLNESFYLAAEINGEPKSFDLHSSSRHGNSLKIDHSYAASGVVGTPLDNMIMAFVRLGYQYTRFEQLNEGKGGFLSGAGLLVNLTRCWDMQLEYNYVMYPSVANVSDPREQEGYLGFVYRLYNW